MRIRGVLIGAVVAAAAAAPAWAQLPIPTVEVPPVPTVQVPVPTVEVPPVPTVRVPVPVPTVQVPIPVPTVVPEVPGVTTHDDGSGDGGGSTGGGSTGGGSGGGAPSGGSGGGSTGGGGTTSGGGTASGDGSGGGGRTSGSRSGSSGGSGGGTSGESGGGGSTARGSNASAAGATGGSADVARTDAARSAGGANARATTAASNGSSADLRAASQRCRTATDRVKRRDCVLRATVKTAGRCLDDLSSAQRRVLTLRAGLRAAPRSRRGVARRLDISVRRVTRLERTGLSRLRRLTGRGACAAPVQTVAAASIAPAAANTETAIRPSGKADRTGGGAEPRDRGGDDKRAGDGGSGGVDTPERRGGVAGVAQTNTPGGLDLTLPLILLAAAIAAALLARTIRRETAPLPAGAPPRPIWIPWRRSTMDGPGWNDPRPAGDREGEWSGESEPPPEHEPWTPPTRRTPTRRT